MEEYAKTVTEDLVKFWQDILRFLASMREERRSFVSQIKFVVQKLSEYLPRFRTLTEDTQINFSDSTHTSRVKNTHPLPPASAMRDDICLQCGSEYAPGTA